MPEYVHRPSLDAPSIADSAEFTTSDTIASPEPVALRDHAPAGANSSPFNPSGEPGSTQQAYEQASNLENGGIDRHGSFVTRQTTNSGGRKSNESSRGLGLLKTFSRVSRSSKEPKDAEKQHADTPPPLGPEHLLETIAEGDSEEEDYMVDLKEAAAVVDTHNTASAIDPKEIKQRRKGYRENLNRHRAIKRYTAGSKAVYFLRRVYRDVLSKTVITRSFIWWLPLAIILFIPLAVDAFGTKKGDTGLLLGWVRVMWLFIWFEVAWGSLWVMNVFCHYLPEVTGFVVSIVAPKYFRYIDLMGALERPLTYVLWMLISMVTFIPITSRNHTDIKKADGIQNWQRVVNNVLVAFLVSSLVYFVEQVFIHLLSISYHRTRMAQRIKRNQKSVSILSLLLYAAYEYFPPFSSEFEQEDEVLASNVMAHTKFAQTKFASFTSKFKLAQNLQKVIGSTANQLSAISRELQPDNPPAEKIVKNALNNKISREILANRIWKSLVMEDSEALTFDDLLDAIGNDRREEVLYIFDVLDLDGQGDISLDEMVSAVRSIGKEQKHISRSLQDIDGAITKLHHVLLIILGIFIIVIFVGMLAPSVGAVLATLGSSLLALSFIFSTTAQEILASCVFLFVKHPADIGDVVNIMVPGVGYQRMRVLELSLLYTVFSDESSNVVRQVPNAVLNTLFIDNVSRSGPMSVVIPLSLGLPETTMEDIEELRSRVTDFLVASPRDYNPGLWMQVTNMADLDRVTLTLSITIRSNMEDTTLFGGRRTRLYEFVAKCIREIPLYTPRRDDMSHTDPGAPMFVQTMPGDSQVKTPQTLGVRQPFGMGDKVINLEAGAGTGNGAKPRSSSMKTTGSAVQATGFRRSNSRATARSVFVRSP